jgi:hypothetical protein
MIDLIKHFTCFQGKAIYQIALRVQFNLFPLHLCPLRRNPCDLCVKF